MLDILTRKVFVKLDPTSIINNRFVSVLPSAFSVLVKSIFDSIIISVLYAGSPKLINSKDNVMYSEVTIRYVLFL